MNKYHIYIISLLLGIVFSSNFNDSILNKSPDLIISNNESNNRDCEDGYVIDCSGDGDCCSETWIGDGFGDCEDQPYGCDLTCYACDAGDCGDENDAGDGCEDDENSHEDLTPIDYDTQIQPIFNNNCTTCHGGDTPTAGLSLTSYDNLMAGSNNGYVIIAGDVSHSTLWEKVNSGEMPPGNNPNLYQDQVDLIGTWISEGANSSSSEDTHFTVSILETGVSQLTIFQTSITSLDIGDEIGIFDSQAITNAYDCSNQIDSLLVGAGTWDGSQLNITSIGSLDLCGFGSSQFPGYVDGNSLLIKIWKQSEQIEYPAIPTYESGAGNFGDIIQAVSELIIDYGEINGCMDYLACNFNQNATQDDGTCTYPANNYDCNGNCITQLDCAGICGGDTQTDECGVCDGNGPSYQCWDSSIECSFNDCPSNPNQATHSGIDDIGTSLQVTLDVIDPTVSITYPNGDEVFNSGEIIYPTFDANDDHLTQTPLSLYLSQSIGANYELLEDSIAVSNVSVTLPNINSSSVSLKVEIIDQFGNTNVDFSDNVFTVGSENNTTTTQSYLINDTGQSILTTLDVVDPLISFIYPNGGEEFEAQQTISLDFDYDEDHLNVRALTIYLSSEIGTAHEILEENALIDNPSITFPNLNSSSVSLAVLITDQFGNNSSDVTDNVFTVGNPQEQTFTQTYLIEDTGQSSQTTLDVVDPEITVAYPNGGEHVGDYSSCYVSCPSSDDHLDQEGLTIEVSFALGGWFVEAAGDIDPYYSSNYNIDLSSGGQIPESIYGVMRATVKDEFGNTKTDMSNGYFILGDPAGDININYIDEEDKTVLIDWSWIENQVIAITDEAIAGLSEYDYIKIYDESAIDTEYCNPNDATVTTGLVILETIDITEEIATQTVTLPCGFDYCSLGGSRIVGYSPGSEIKFSVGTVDQEFDIVPISSQLVDGDMTFNDSTYVITSFTIGNRIDNTNNNAISLDDRDIDNFNVYSRVTNHQGGINRDCNNDGVCDPGEALANCFDDCCDVPGIGDNLEWCFEEELDGITTYYANLNNGNYIPNNQGSATINYRIWLLDQNGDEAVKTLDTEGIEYTGDLSNIYEEDLVSGWNWKSFNVSTDDMDANQIFSQFTEPEWQCDYGGANTDCPAYIKSQTSFGIYYTGFGFYPSFDLSVEEFYKIQMNAPSQLLYQGALTDPALTPIALGTGWNWIGYIPTETMGSNTALAGIIANNSPFYLKGQTGFGIFYENFGFYPEISMEPHQGYMLQMTQVDNLTYPSGALLSNNSNHIRLSDANNFYTVDYAQYEYNASATLELDMNHLEISENDEIAVFYENECRGVVKADICPINDKLVFSLMFYSNNEQENDLTIKYYNALSNTEIEVRETLDFVMDTNIGDIYTPILLHDMAVPMTYKLSNPYPNPFNPVTQINFELPENVDNLRLDIYDIRGRLVETLHSGSMSYGYHSYKWNANHFASGIYFVHMLTGDNRFTKKITLLK